MSTAAWMDAGGWSRTFVAAALIEANKLVTAQNGNVVQ